MEKTLHTVVAAIARGKLPQGSAQRNERPRTHAVLHGGEVSVDHQAAADVDRRLPAPLLLDEERPVTQRQHEAGARPGPAHPLDEDAAILDPGTDPPRPSPRAYSALSALTCSTCASARLPIGPAFGSQFGPRSKVTTPPLATTFRNHSRHRPVG